MRGADRLDEALAAVELVIADAPEYAPAWELKGRILWDGRRKDEGRAAYERACEAFQATAENFDGEQKEDASFGLEQLRWVARTHVPNGVLAAGPSETGP